MVFNFFDRAERPKNPQPLTPLQAACESGDLDAIRALASAANTDDISAALCRACQEDNTAVVETLLEIPNVDANAATEGNTPLFNAASGVWPETIKSLLKRGADAKLSSRGRVRNDGPPLSTPLHGLFHELWRKPLTEPEHIERCTQSTRLLLDAGCDVNAQDGAGVTILLDCVTHELPLPLTLLVLESGADPNIEDSNGRSPLHFLHNPEQNREVLHALMAHGAKLDSASGKGEGSTPLHSLASKGVLGDLSLFSPYVTDWNVRDAKGNTVLHKAAGNHRRGSKTLSELLKLGLDPEARNHEGKQAVHVVGGIPDNVADALDIFCAAGLDLEGRDHQGRTLLAIQMYGRPPYNYKELLPLLISRGTNINTQDYKGNGVLHYLITPYSFQPEHLDFLLSLGADPGLANYEGDTFLHRLAANLATIVEDTALAALLKLLKTGIPTATTLNFKGQTPLHSLCTTASEHFFAAAAQGGKYAVDLVLDAGLSAGLNIADNQGVLPIHRAATTSEVLVANLISRGADTTTPTSDGRTLLHIASTARQSNIVGLLLDHYSAINKLDMVNMRTKDGRTPLHDACRSGRLETVLLLLQHGASVEIEDASRRLPLAACAEFEAEDWLWGGADEDQNLFNTLTAAGVLADDEQRPKQLGSRKNKKRKRDREPPRRIGWKGEISSDRATVGIGRIVRALASHGALTAAGTRMGSDPMFQATFAGSEEMIAELDRHMQNRQSLETQCYLLRSQHLVGLLEERFKEYLSAHDVLAMALMGHQEETAQAIERSAETLADNPAWSEILVHLARWGFYELFDRIGKIMTTEGWVNGVGAGNKLGKKLPPYLLVAGDRELPNLEVIKVIVEQFNADVNVQYEAETATVPHMYFESKAASGRRYKPGDTLLHHLAQGGHWWHEGAIKYLLQHGADPNIQNPDGKTPLCYAVTRGDMGGYRQREITRILLEGGADPNITAHCGYTPLAMSTHDPELFQLLIDNGAYPSMEHPMELFSALYSFNEDVVSALLGMDLDCNTTVLSDQQTHWHTHRVRKVPREPNRVLHPLHYISMLPFNEEHSRENAIRMIRCLLQHGADPFLPCDTDIFILHDIFADGGIIQPWTEMPDLDLEHRDPRGRTLLLAAAGCSVGTASYGCSIPILPFRAGAGGIQSAAWVEGDLTRAMTLYQRGADLTAVDLLGNNVLHIIVGVSGGDQAATAELARTVKLFLEKAPILGSQRNIIGQTPLHVAELKQTAWAVEVLGRQGESQMAS